MPSALSTSRTPSGVAVNDVTDCLHYPLLDFGKRPAHTSPGRQGMAASTEFLTDGTNVDRRIFRAHTDADFAVEEFFEKNSDNYTADGADMIDQALVILGNHSELCGGGETETKARDLATCLEAHRAEQLTEKLHATARIVFIELLADASDLNASTNELRCYFQRSCRRV